MKDLTKIKSILYVEDEKGVREELSEIIELFCNRLHVAKDGAQGLEFYKRYKPEIVITDISMPNMDGITMSREIKKLNENVHIIFTTAFSDSEFFQNAIELQVEGYILKPIDLELLEKKIKSITKIIELQKEKNRLQESKLSAMSEMLSAIAHQWRQPLNVVNGILYNLADAYENDDLTSEYFEEMLTMANKNLQFMSTTIDDFKNFSKPTHKSDFFFESIIVALNSIVLAQLQDNSIKLNFHIDKELKLYGSKNELEHVLLNLINNARDAIVESGVENGEITLELQESSTDVIIYLKDNANGIAQNIQERIFEPYFTTKKEGEGTGIGLYLSKMILQKSFNATIILEQSSPQGSTFVIKIPKIPLEA